MGSVIPVRDDTGTVRGQIQGDAFVISRRRDSHYLITKGGWGLNLSIWRTLMRQDRVRIIVIREPDTGDRYMAEMMKLKELEWAGDLERITYADEQVVLREEWFERTESEQKHLF